MREMTVALFNVIRALLQHTNFEVKGTDTQDAFGCLGAELGLNRKGIVQKVASLERRGLLEVTRSPDGGRILSIKLTSEGVKLASDNAAYHLRVVKERERSKATRTTISAANFTRRPLRGEIRPYGPVVALA